MTESSFSVLELHELSFTLIIEGVWGETGDGQPDGGVLAVTGWAVNCGVSGLSGDSSNCQTVWATVAVGRSLSRVQWIRRRWTLVGVTTTE